jgi:MFS transporter, DHA2 family, multidrug resistance protein
MTGDCACKTPPPVAPGPRAGRREWAGLAVLALPAFVIALDFSVLNLAVPVISRELMPTGTELLWIVDIYGFILAGFLVTMGTLGDCIGRRRLLMLGAAGFGLASAAAAYSVSAGMLIGARAVLGLAGATLMPSTLSLISNMFRDGKQRTVAIAVWSTSLPLGGAVGPLIGGAMLQVFWWGAVFLLAVPVMVILLATGPILLPEYRNAAAGRPDFLSVGLSLAAILPVVYGLTEIAKGGFRPVPVAAVVAGLLAGWGFVRRQRTLADPLIDLRLFGQPGFSAALGINTLVYFVILGMLLLISQYLQLVLGQSSLRAGLWMLPTMGGLIGGSLVTPLFARRLHPAFTMAAGLAVAAAGFGLLTQTSSLGLAAVGDRVGGVRAGGRPGDQPGDRDGARVSPAAMGRDGFRSVGDQHRARRRPRHRHLGQHQHRRLPLPRDAGHPARHSRSCRAGHRRDPGRRHHHSRAAARAGLGRRPPGRPRGVHQRGGRRSRDQRGHRGGARSGRRGTTAAGNPVRRGV